MLHIKWVIQFEFCHYVPVLSHVLYVYQLEGWDGLSREKLQFSTLRLVLFSHLLNINCW
jgi:hypothetical protein